MGDQKHTLTYGWGEVQVSVNVVFVPHSVIRPDGASMVSSISTISDVCTYHSRR